MYCPGMPKSTLAVRSDEDPWTSEESAEVGSEVEAVVVRLRTELDLSGKELQDLLREGVEDAGHDEADVGS